MKTPILLIAIAMILASCGANGKRKAHDNTGINELQAAAAAGRLGEPDYNYIIRVLPGWGMFDTSFSGLETRLIVAPARLDEENIKGNITIGYMEGKGIDEHMRANMEYLQKTPDITPLENGKFKIDSLDVGWSTYTRSQNGLKRDMIFYAIAANGFAYQVTFGVNSPGMKQWRPKFDEMVKTFSLFPLNKFVEKTGAEALRDSSTYLATGFYFLGDENNGVKMREEHTGETYYIRNKPFAPVANLEKARLYRERLPQGIVPILQLKFDEQGTEMISHGTSAKAANKIAVVVANRLLYVVDNQSDGVHTGIMTILLDGYSDEDCENMLNAVLHRR